MTKSLAPIDFAEVRQRAQAFADTLAENHGLIVKSLSEYQCANVALDEIERSVELLTNLHLNQEYFQAKVHGVTTFLPLNQPLYASVCFGVVPSLMAEDTAMRPPTVMHPHYRKLAEILDLPSFFPNLTVSYQDKEEYLVARARRTDAVVFTGTPENAVKVRRAFLKKTLFILNGAGHNPLVVTENADLDRAVDSALRVVLYNQGQDCAAPNAILVHRSRIDVFRAALIRALDELAPRVGPYSDPANIVGPNSDPDHAAKIARVFRDEREHFVYGGETNPVTGMIHPTVFERDLTKGGNYEEFFAPVFYIQPYESDDALKDYFTDERYRQNAMYISLFGDSPYIKSLVDTPLHEPDSVLRDTDLHLTEKGYLPYGGQGPAASCLYTNGERVLGATLPQRDIHRHLVAPHLEGAC
ncbi:aldehyde dehydrogenase family protein [Kibdelosporangium philippinense]|uniref:Aldehyde dehydrogenase family protein n=1 Tax=Kibdelosporangium philippinense TaxID=211113 RepID=A0ABS8Z6L9_9PSEU|nr:aldehyde dehydrogenase family protein [Kibdelosporangium philippinense]MCE7003524.1 aldehyde dehydrogenase family protein [Kibdelosporangium philippinense]